MKKFNGHDKFYDSLKKKSSDLGVYKIVSENL